MLSWKYLVLLGAGTLGLATWAGYRSERDQVMETAAGQPVASESPVRRADAPKSRGNPVDKLKELRQRAGRTSLSAAESAAAWQIIRNFSAAEVQAFLEENSKEPLNTNNDLLGMLFFRWGQLDPEAAAQAATQPPYNLGQYCLGFVVTSWADRDPEAVLRWAAKGDLNVQYLAGDATGRVLVQQDPASALDKVKDLFPMAIRGVASALAGRTDDTEESRRAVLSRLAGLTDQGVLSAYLSRLMSRVGNDPQLSADKLLAELEQASLPEEQMARAKARLQSSPVPYGIPEEPRKPQESVDTKLPLEAQKATYTNWANNAPEKAAAWAAQNNRPDLLTDSLQKQSMRLLRTDWQPGKTDDPAVKGLALQYEAWRKMDSASAEAWLDAMPGDIRKQLSQAAHATR